MLSNRRLYYRAGNSNITIKTYTSLGDIYTGKGLPFTYRGEKLYAPLVSLSDVFSSPLKVKDSSGTWAVAYDTVGTSQRQDFKETKSIILSGDREQEITYNSFPVVAPYSGYYNLYSQIKGGQTGSGYSRDKWQWSKWWLDLDGVNFFEKEYRRSQGMGYKDLYNDKIYMEGGAHIITLRIRGKCSSKDSHETRCDEWNNTITII